MKILYLGSDELLARLRKQTIGQTWEIHHAKELDHILDFEGTHVFQAALIELYTDECRIRTAAQNVKKVLRVPVVIGLLSQDQAVGFSEKLQQGLDTVVPECGNDRLTKLQCDAILRFANGTPSESILCGGVTFQISEDRFSVSGREIHLPPKNHKLLELLFLKRGRTVTKDMVFNHLYGWDEPPEAKIVDVFVCQIRRILREADLNQDCIQTVWGQGYRIPEDATMEARFAA